MVVTLNNKGAAGYYITDALFGANMLTHTNGDNGQVSTTYTEAYTALDATGVRYPGGSVTELYFDMAAPHTRHPGIAEERYISLDNAIAFANEHNAPMTFVLPTRVFIDTDLPVSGVPRDFQAEVLADLSGFVTDLYATYGADLPIDTFQIGNEYWGVAELTAAEYALVADAVTLTLVETFEALRLSDEPDILVQMANPWSPEFARGGILDQLDTATPFLAANGLSEDDYVDGRLRWTSKIEAGHDAILDGLSAEAKAEIDGLTQHYYYQPDDLAFEAEEDGANYIADAYARYQAEGFAHAELHLTEWNIERTNATESGLRGASTLLEQFKNIVNLGTSSAHLWPPVLPTPSNMWEWKGSNDGLTPSGVMLSELRALSGYMALDLDSGDPALATEGFTNGAQTSVFLSARSETAITTTIDFSDVLPSWETVTFEVIRYDPDTADGAHFFGSLRKTVPMVQDHDALGIVEAVDFDVDGSEITVTLAPFEVLHVQFESDPTDVVIGTDGADKLFGTGGLIYGGLGHDRLIGGESAENIYGGAGNDTIIDLDERAQDWTNLNKDAEPNDENVLSGGDGHDLIFGNAGRDVLFGGAGDDFLSGGAGRDTFVFESGHDVFADFAPYVDEIVISAETQDRHSLTTLDDVPTPELVSGQWVFSFSQDDQFVISGSVDVALVIAAIDFA